MARRPTCDSTTPTDEQVEVMTYWTEADLKARTNPIRRPAPYLGRCSECGTLQRRTKAGIRRHVR
jgi:hypothetical protein